MSEPIPYTDDLFEKANYIGNKRRFAAYIVKKFPEGTKTVFDPMTGCSAVLIEAAKKGMRVRGNDLSPVALWYSKGIFEGAELSEKEAENLLNVTLQSGWLTTKWEGKYPRKPEIRKFIDGLMLTVRRYQGKKKLTAQAVASRLLQTMYGESGSGFFTINWETIPDVKRILGKAIKEVNTLIKEVGGKGTISSDDARTMAFPKSDVVYFDPPYFRKDKGALKYFQAYRIVNTILMQSEWRQKDLGPDEMPGIVQRLCKSTRHVFVSSARNSQIPWVSELGKHKKAVRKFSLTYHQNSGLGGRDTEQRQNLLVAKSLLETEKENQMKAIPFEANLDVLKAYEEEERWIIEGFAATTDFDLQDDIITEQAIKASAKDLMQNSTVLLNHNSNDSIGKVEKSEARTGGLWLKIFVSKTVPNIWQKIQEGVLNKFSIRGRILKAKKQWIPKLEKFARVIFKMHLLEVSIVSVPANPKAKALRWYIEKALEDYEAEGGKLEEMESDNVPINDNEGEVPMEEQNEVTEELVEAWGEADENGDETQKTGDELIKSKTGVDSGKAQSNAAEKSAEQIASLMDELIKGEKDGLRKNAFSHIRDIAKELMAEDDEELEKAGRKISASRLTRLQKLLEQLQKLVAEVEPAGKNDDKAGETKKDTGEIEAKLQGLEDSVEQISKLLGIPKDADTAKEGDLSLVDAVKKLAERLGAIEGMPAVKTSIDGQESLADEKQEGGVWKGLI